VVTLNEDDLRQAEIADLEEMMEYEPVPTWRQVLESTTWAEAWAVLRTIDWRDLRAWWRGER
jgi:hypothetical protein